MVGFIQDSIGGGRENGLYISHNPNLWKAGQPGMATYEVEIGDQASKAAWQNAPNPFRSDFTALRIRFLRPVPESELAKMPVTAEDMSGMGLQNVLRKLREL